MTQPPLATADVPGAVREDGSTRSGIGPRARFLALLDEAIGSAAWPLRLVLAKHVGATPDLVRVQARPVRVKGETLISFLYRYSTRDVTVNLPVQEALRRVDELLGSEFHQANLLVPAAESQLTFSRWGKPLLRTMKRTARDEPVGNPVDKLTEAVDKPGSSVHSRGDKPVDKPADRVDKTVDNRANSRVDKPVHNPSGNEIDEPSGRSAERPANDAAQKSRGTAAGRSVDKPVDNPVGKAVDKSHEALSHNRAKQRVTSLDRPFLRALGVTDEHGCLIPSMSRKWKQINRFIEVFTVAWNASDLGRRPDVLRAIDFGAGKGYLTFALHDHLQKTLAKRVETTGVERRADLVKTCSDAVEALGIDGLAFRQGDIAGYGSQARDFDVMIALHACDTATDDAIHQGIRAGATIIMCAPCCHQQLRPQLLSPHPLRPILQHGIHLAQEAEMLTDGLRALLLEACGYDAQVFEFVSLEHTSKNKMILATKRPTPRPAGPILAQIREIKSFYGISEQRLESLLRPIIPSLPQEAAS